MRTIQLLFIALFISSFAIAQEVKKPLDPKSKTEIVPEAPGEDYAWVKSHWMWDGGKYTWKEGYYIEAKEGYDWIDGDWERNVKTGWWRFNEGYWRKRGDGVEFKNKVEYVAEKPTMDFDRLNTKTSEPVYQPTMSGGSQVNIESTQTEKKSIMIKTSK